MRLSGEVHSEEEEENKETVKGEEVTVPKMVVGYALTSKKKRSFLQPEFEALARYVTESLCICLCVSKCSFLLLLLLLLKSLISICS